MQNSDDCEKNGSCSGFCCTRIEKFGVTIGKNRILEDVNLHIHCGELTAVIGPNGAGKSTLLKAILGEIRHTGSIHFDSTSGGRPTVGYVPQYLSFDLSTPTSVLDLFSACLSRFPAWMGSRRTVRERAEKGLARVNAEKLLNRRLGALSGGELQRVLLALSLEPVPNLLLLDEPVSGIDRGGLELFYETVSRIRKNYDLSIILVSHDLEMVAKFADRVVLLNGRVARNGKPKEVFESEQMKELFGMSFVNLDFGGKGGEQDA
jgi:zinc transport system ATP-binding protein